LLDGAGLVGRFESFESTSEGGLRKGRRVRGNRRKGKDGKGGMKRKKREKTHLKNRLFVVREACRIIESVLNSREAEKVAHQR
jgi:hypothetical protein